MCQTRGSWWWDTAAAAAKSIQSCPTLCDPLDSSPPGSAVPGIFQARTLEWVAISFSNAWKWKVKVKSLSYVWLFATPWTAAHQAPLPMGFSRQEYWSQLPLPSPMRHWLCTKSHWVPTERLHWGPTLTATQDTGQMEVLPTPRFCCASRCLQHIYKLCIWSRAPCLSMFVASPFASPCFFPLRQVREVLQEEGLEQRSCRQYMMYSTWSSQGHYTRQRLRSLTVPQVSGWSKRKKCLLKDWA